MKILFLTIVKISTLEEGGIYTDLLRKFRDEGHEVFIISPIERRYKTGTNIKKEKGATLLQVKTFNIQKTNVIEKGLGTLAIESQFLRALKKSFSKEKFDLILYSTPPITFTKVINFIKSRDQAYSYLLLKDIFPQNAVDLHLMKKDGMLHKLFLKKERQLYEASDTIGCMSIANKDYIMRHNPYLVAEKIEVNPNSIDLLPIEQQSKISKLALRDKYNLPDNKMIFVYGGNLGLPQGIDFLLQTIENCSNQNVYFLIVGSGREYTRIAKWFVQNKPINARLLQSLPKKDYDSLVGTCDVGMIFLNPDFTIPNFPSRLLSYLEYGMPVLAATDKSTDVGKVVEDAKCGLWVQSGDIKAMLCAINKLIENEDDFLVMKQNARMLLENEYTVDVSYHLIENKVRMHV
jgi:glycosyltransferase involved in cell wall biosynthesis